MITVAALALGLAAPALAQDAKPAVTAPVAPAARSVDTTKPQPAAATDTTKPVTKASDVKADSGKDAKDVKKVDQGAGLAPATQPGAAPKADAGKTSEKPAETKKQ
jgi:hypothetical protein